MSRERELAAAAFEGLLEAARVEAIPSDVVGRALLSCVVEEWLATRSWRDVASELAFVADSLDPETGFQFMRP